MRVLHIITRLILGGAQENTLLSVLGQQEIPGWSVRLLAGPPEGPEGSLVETARARHVDLVECAGLVRPLRPLADFRAYVALRKHIRAYAPDVVHTHSSKAGVLGRMAAWAETVPFVVHTIHGLPFHPYQSALAHRCFVRAERFAARRCHRIVSVADSMTAEALEAGVGRPEQYETVYSGMEIEPFLDSNRDRDAVRARFGLSPDDIVIGKIARLFELKGHEFLFPVFRALLADEPRLRLLLVGGGPWRERFEREVADLGVADRVVFTGVVPREEIPDALAAMDMVVHCSLREGLARVLPQALLTATPVISFDVNGAREVVVDGETGRLLPPADTDALEAAVRGYLDDPARARAMAEEGRRRCIERFDRRVMVDRLRDIYERGLAGREGEAS